MRYPSSHVGAARPPFMNDESTAVENSFGAYTLIREIGRGGMATVHEARHRELGKRVAIKILSEAMASLPNGAARFFREARTVAQLRHPHIVDALDFGAADGRPFLVMELLEGDDLATFLRRRGTLAPAELVDLLLPVISAISAAHGSGVVHRDLKPSNILVARHGGRLHPTVVDFGVSKRDDDSRDDLLTRPEAILGTIPYMAPEQVRGARNASRLSDQYAIGIILYQCATGVLPFAGEDDYDTMTSIVRAKVIPPSERNPAVSRTLNAVILRAMHRDPARRFPSAHALGSALFSFASLEARAIWSAEFGSDAPLENGASADRDGQPVSDPTHVTEVVGDPSRVLPWHRRVLLGALVFAFVAITMGMLARQPSRIATSFTSSGHERVKAGTGKEVADGPRDALGTAPAVDGPKVPVRVSVRAARPPTKLALTVTEQPRVEPRPASTASGEVRPNGAPIVE